MKTVRSKWNFLALLIIGGILLVAAPMAQAETWTGDVSDLMCGVKHKMAGKSATECATMCIQKGSKYSLVVGSKVYELTGKTEGLDKLAGQKATVSGTVNGDKIEVDSVSAAS